MIDVEKHNLAGRAFYCFHSGIYMSRPFGGVRFENSRESCRKSTQLMCLRPNQRIGMARDEELQCASESS